MRPRAKLRRAVEQDHFEDLHRYVDDWADTLRPLRQSVLLTATDLEWLAHNCGLASATGLLSRLHEQDCLQRDDALPDGRPLFHPFRAWVVRQALLRQDRVEALNQRVRVAKELVNLAVLLEPLYWPLITGIRRISVGDEGEPHPDQKESYFTAVRNLVKSLRAEVWQGRHAFLLKDAPRLDENRELYLLLRLSSWKQREDLRGQIAGALWIRHIAEVIRRGFEEVHGEKWPEEDQAFPMSRERLYGSERPLDDPDRSRPNVVRRFGLSTGSAVRWYVEGATEYYAVRELLPDAELLGIELMNLSGALPKNKGNAALNLQQWLQEDARQKRFSILMFDEDRADTRKTINAQLPHVVGSVFMSKPDFEFWNFTLSELVDVAARMDESQGLPVEGLRGADWNEVATGAEFDKRYSSASASHRPLKGEKWGRTLARFAAEHPKRPGDSEERPFLQAVTHAILARSSNYGHDKENFRIDPATYRRVQRPTLENE